MSLKVSFIYENIQEIEVDLKSDLSKINSIRQGKLSFIEINLKGLTTAGQFYF